MSFEWMDRAACKGLTHKMFPSEFKDVSYVSEAREICSGCPVAVECLEYALEFTAVEMHGVWAGLTSNQLAREQRRRGVVPSRATIAQIFNHGEKRVRGVRRTNEPVVRRKRGRPPKTGGS